MKQIAETPHIAHRSDGGPGDAADFVLFDQRGLHTVAGRPDDRLLPALDKSPTETGWTRMARVNSDKFFQVAEPLKRFAQPITIFRLDGTRESGSQNRRFSPITLDSHTMRRIVCVA